MVSATSSLGIVFVPSPSTMTSSTPTTCVKIKFYGAFVLNRRVDLHAIDVHRHTG